jgi:hypothetical protein
MSINTTLIDVTKVHEQHRAPHDEEDNPPIITFSPVSPPLGLEGEDALSELPRGQQQVHKHGQEDLGGSLS